MSQINLISLLSLLSGLANVALAAFVMGKDSRSRVNRSLAYLAMCFAMWGIGEFFMRQAGNPETALFWVRIEALGYVGVGSVYLRFSLLYSEQDHLLKRYWLRSALLIPPFIFLGLIWLTTTVYPGVETYPWGNRPSVGLAFYPLVAYIAIEWVAGGLVFAKRVKKLGAGHERQATLYLLIGTVLPIIVATLTAGIFPILGVDLPEMATHVSIVNAVILVYIIQRYQVLTFVPSRFADTLVASTGDAIIATDPMGSVIYFSPGAEEMFGYRADRVVDKSVVALFTQGEDEWKNLTVLLEQAESVRNYHTEMLRSDHKALTTSITLSYLRNESDNPVGTVSVIRDITEFSRLQDQLMKTQRLDSLGSLASGITHDFNNVLSIILPWTQMLKIRRSDDPLVVEHADRIEQAATSASELVRRLLTFARGSSKQTMVLSPSRLIEDTIEMLDRTIPSAVHLEMELGEDIPDVEADHLQFEQALVNLILNSVDAMPGGGTIKVDCRRLVTEVPSSRRRFTLPAGDWVVVSVRDTGQGIPVERLDQIFNPFFTTKPGGKGTGLGLTIVETFVGNNSGYMDVYSHPGVSTTFELILPTTSRHLSRELAAASDPRKGRGERLIIVDGNREIRDTLVQMLRELDYRVEGSESFTFCLAQLAQMRADGSAPQPDLIIIEAEGLSGEGEDPFVLLQRVLPKARVLLTSTGSIPDTSLIGEHTGVTGILYKPFELEEVMLSVRQALDVEIVDQSTRKK